MEPKLNQVGGLTILREHENRQTIHVELAKGKLEQQDKDNIIKFDTSRSIADQMSEQLRSNSTFQHPEKKL